MVQPVDPSEYLDRFLEHKSTPTANKYRSYLSRMLSWLRGKNIEVGDITYSTIDSFMDSLVVLGSTSKRLVWAIMSSFFKYLQRVAAVKENPCAGSCPVPPAAPPSRYLEKKDVVKLLESARSVGPRFYVTTKLLYGSGFRASELCGLRLCDVTRADKARYKLKTVGKGNRPRTVLLNTEMSNVLCRWLRIVERRGHAYVFPGRHSGTGISRTSLHRLVKKAAIKAGLPHVSAHALRYVMGTTPCV